MLPSPPQTMTCRDDCNLPTRAGDRVRFSYGIPPRVVVAEVVEQDGRLVVLCPGHHPESAPLRSLRRMVGEWFRVG